MSIIKNPIFYLILILILAFSLRLYKISSPIADWHSWRQADTAAVTRNFIKEGFNPFLPKYDDMSIVSENSIPNLSRFRFVEFPVYNMTVYPLYLLFGVNEMLHRLVSVIFSLLSLIFLYLVVRKYLGEIHALLSSLIFAILPFNVFFSRTTLPEPAFVFFCLAMIYFIDKWIFQGGRTLFNLALFFSAVSFLIKPWAIFFFIPCLYLVVKKEGKIWPLPKKYLIFFLLALLPFTLWRVWIMQSPEGIPAAAWLLNGDGIRFKPIFWWWIISERLAREILGAVGFVLFALGLIIRPKDGNWFFHIWALSMFSFFVIFATGNVRHDYYQIIFVPIACIILAKGFIFLIKGESLFVPRIWTIIMGVLFLPLTFYFGWKEVGGFYQINNPAILEVGKKADDILPKNAVVVAPYNGDTAFLYHIRRPGWPVVAFPMDQLIKKYGVTYYVSTTKDTKTSWVMRHFAIVEEGKDYVIANLTKQKKEFDTGDPEPL